MPATTQRAARHARKMTSLVLLPLRAYRYTAVGLFLFFAAQETDNRARLTFSQVPGIWEMTFMEDEIVSTGILQLSTPSQALSPGDKKYTTPCFSQCLR